MDPGPTATVEGFCKIEVCYLVSYSKGVSNSFIGNGLAEIEEWDGPVEVYKYGNDLDELKLTGNTNKLYASAYEIICSGCGLSELKVGFVGELYCSKNNLRDLKVNCEYLKILDCSNNNLCKCALNDLFESLHSKNSEFYEGKTVTITGNPGAADCDRTIAEKKGWTVIG